MEAMALQFDLAIKSGYFFFFLVFQILMAIGPFGFSYLLATTQCHRKPKCQFQPIDRYLKVL